LVPPLAQLPIAAIQWDRDFLPEHLWIASLRTIAPLERLHEPFYAFMDAVDEFWSQEGPALGLLTDFGLLGAHANSFLAKHAALVRDLFLVPFGRILAFFPESPASWLLTEPFLEAQGPLDPDVELGRLRALVADLFDPRNPGRNPGRCNCINLIVFSGWPCPAVPAWMPFRSSSGPFGPALRPGSSTGVRHHVMLPLSTGGRVLGDVVLGDVVK